MSARRLVTIMRENAHRLDKMVKDVLELSRRDRVQRQDVDASNPLVTTILSPLGSMRYAAFSTRALVSVYGRHGQLLQFLFGILEALAVPSRLKY